MINVLHFNILHFTRYLRQSIYNLLITIVCLSAYLSVCLFIHTYHFLPDSVCVRISFFSLSLSLYLSLSPSHSIFLSLSSSLSIFLFSISSKSLSLSLPPSLCLSFFPSFISPSPLLLFASHCLLLRIFHFLQMNRNRSGSDTMVNSSGNVWCKICCYCNEHGMYC